VSGQLWAATVALNDAVTEYHRLHRQLQSVARSVGITREQRQAIKQGTQADLPPADKPICDHGQSSSFSPGT
jgi:hypothetical protein